jgi:hypothetical protein
LGSSEPPATLLGQIWEWTRAWLHLVGRDCLAFMIGLVKILAGGRCPVDGLDGWEDGRTDRWMDLPVPPVGTRA